MGKNKTQDEKQREIRKKVKPLTEMEEKMTDPQGSWTGRPDDPKDLPQQDADDL